MRNKVTLAAALAGTATLLQAVAPNDAEAYAKIVAYPGANGTDAHVFVMRSDDGPQPYCKYYYIEEYFYSPSAGWRYSKVLSPFVVLGGSFAGLYERHDNQDHLYFLSYDPNPPYTLKVVGIRTGDGLHGSGQTWSRDNLPEPSSGPGHNYTTFVPAGKQPVGRTDTPMGCLLGPVTGSPPLVAYYDGTNQSVWAYGSRVAGDYPNVLMHTYVSNNTWNWAAETHDAAINIGANGSEGISGGWDGTAQHIYYNGLDGIFHELYTSGNQWWPNNLSAAVQPNLTSAQIPAGKFSSSVANGIQTIWGAQQGGAPGMRWLAYYNHWVSGVINAPYLTSSSPTVSYNGIPFYIGSDQNIYNPNVNENITQKVGFPAAKAADGALSPIAGYQDATGTSHIFYIATDNHLHEYWSSGNSWGWTDLSWSSGSNATYSLKDQY
ncbi:MAG: hypothetical protein QM778_28790 [Myxococcales bacterium]